MERRRLRATKEFTAQRDDESKLPLTVRAGQDVFAAIYEGGDVVRFTFDALPGFFIIDRQVLLSSTVLHVVAVERYTKEFAAIMQDAELRERHANHLRGVDSLEKLFESAARVGINQTEAWRIVERDESDPKGCVLALIDAVKIRTA